MKILLGHVYSEYSNNTNEKVAAWMNRLRTNGIDIDSICLSPTTAQPVIYWPELDHRWKAGDVHLMKMYEILARKIEQYDVFVNFNGINLHPEFVRQLSGIKVYSCSDDPESSEILSKPVAWAYDLALVGNIAQVEAYRDWGVKNARFWPLGYRFEDYDPSLTKDQILQGERDVDLVLLCERVTPWRRERLDQYSSAFPKAAFYGLGWPNGSLPEEQRVKLFQRSKIGVNIHNSTGPINFRAYYLPANGILQICDNKHYLGRIYELGKEVVGFDSIEEAIELTNHYLSHDDERRQIAANGWERATRDYNEVAIFNSLIAAVNEITEKRNSKSSRRALILIYTKSWKHKTINVIKPIFNIWNAVLFKLAKKIKSLIDPI